MRDILFRGKRIDNSMWIYGSLRQYKDGTCGICDRELEHTYRVDPNTAGEYTGMNDKNGKKIFEGDILKIAKKFDSLGTYFFPPVEYPTTATVRWDLCSWLWEVQWKDGPYYIHFPNAWCHYECEVVGNIYDEEGDDA